MSARPFTFDTVFDGAGDVVSEAPRPKRNYTAEGMEAARAEAFAEGEASAVARAEQAKAQALSRIAEAAEAALSVLSQVAHAHREDAAALALACGKAVAGAALERFPAAPLEAALETLGREIETAPRLELRLADPDPEVIAAAERAVEAAGYAGRLSVRAEPGPVRAAFQFDWGDGRARFDPEDAAARVTDALTSALAAEGAHAEALPPIPRPRG